MPSGTKLSRAPAWSRSSSAKGPRGCRETSLSRNFPFLCTSQPKDETHTSVMDASRGFGFPRAPHQPVVGKSHRSRRMHARGEHTAAANEHSLTTHLKARHVSRHTTTHSPRHSSHTPSTRRSISGDGVNGQPSKPKPIRVPSTSLAMCCARMVDEDGALMGNKTGGETARISSSKSCGESPTRDDDVESLPHLHAPLDSIPEGQCYSTPGVLLDHESRWENRSHISTLDSSCRDASESSVSLGIDRDPLRTFPPPVGSSSDSRNLQACDTSSACTQQSEKIRQGCGSREHLGRSLQLSWPGESATASTSDSFPTGAAPTDYEWCVERDRISAEVLEDSARDPSQAGSARDVDCSGQGGDGAPRHGSAGTPLLSILMHT